MNLEDALPYVDVKIGEETVRFAKLSPRDRARILTNKKADDRKLRIDQLDRSGITGDLYDDRLRAFDRTPYIWKDFADLFNTLEGKVLILEIACRKSNGEKSENYLDILTLNDSELVILTAKLAGVVLVQTGDAPDPQNEAPDGESDSARPPAPAIR